MLVAAAVCPHPPLLVPEVAAGAAAELDTLRAACDTAVRRLLDSNPELVAVVGSAPEAGVLHATGGTFAPYGVQVRAGAGAPDLPLAHTVGAWLLDRARFRGERRHWGVTHLGDPDAVARNVTDAGGRVALLVMGDGSARRNEKAPGHLDERAGPYDAETGRAFRSGPDAVRALDGGLAGELLVAGWPAWQVLARAAAGRAWRCETLFEDAPYGVGYFVASWSPS